jgi:hypothetical protein
MQNTSPQPPIPVRIVQKDWKPTTAGILDIIAGAFSLIGALVFLIIMAVIGTAEVFSGEEQAVIDVINVMFGIGVVFFLATGVLALIGGVYATRRQKWGLALAGSIAAALGSTVIGVLAIIFLAMSRDEFTG